MVLLRHNLAQCLSQPPLVIHNQCRSRCTRRRHGHRGVTVNGSTVTVTQAGVYRFTGTLRVTAVNDAVRGRDSVTVLDGALVLNAGSDGIQANNDTDAEKGLRAVL